MPTPRDSPGGAWCGGYWCAPRELRGLERTKQTLITRHETDLENNIYVLNLLTHLQADDVPLKTVDGLRDAPP
jgi:hypothetical protein